MIGEVSWDPKKDDCRPLSIQSFLEQTEHLVVFWEFGLPVGYCMGLDDIGHPAAISICGGLRELLCWS